jgi:hypothetical protein
MPEVRPFATTETLNLVNAAAINQKQLLRLQLAAQILSGIITGNDALWCRDSDASCSDKEMTDRALKFADLLLKKVTESAD